MSRAAEELALVADGVRRAERRAIAKAITLVESDHPEDELAAAALLAELAPTARRALRLGVTGAPGVGKSTLIDALGVRAVAEARRVAVLAIDPSSVRTGGSLLGDRTRMGRLATSEQAFVRPSPSSGAQGGIGPRTREAVIVLEAAGYDVVIIETVGVGQGELAVTDVADVLLVLWMAGAGDDVQGIKRGILEHADLVAFTKADGPNGDSARAERDRLHGLFSMLRRDAPTVLAVSALSAEDVQSLWRATLERLEVLERTGELAQRRRAQRRAWFQSALQQALAARVTRDSALSSERAKLEAAVERGELLPVLAAKQLIERL